MLKITTTGLDKAIQRLEEISRNARALHGKHSVPVEELLDAAFLRKHTRFTSLEAMIEASGFKIETKEDFAAIPDAEWDAFIRQNSKFATWQDMLHAAAGDWAGKKLGL